MERVGRARWTVAKLRESRVTNESNLSLCPGLPICALQIRTTATFLWALRRKRFALQTPSRNEVQRKNSRSQDALANTREA